MFHQVYEAFCAVGSGQRQIVNVAPDKRRVHFDERWRRWVLTCRAALQNHIGNGSIPIGPSEGGWAHKWVIIYFDILVYILYPPHTERIGGIHTI